MAESRICSVEGCGKNVQARGWCQTHYDRWRNHGNPLAGKKSTAPKGAGLSFLENVISANPPGCVIWPFESSEKTRYILVYVDGVAVNAHRYVCEKAHGAPPSPTHEAAHSCRNTKCCSPLHLRWATPLENQHDRHVDGTDNVGERNSAAKLSEDDVRKIRSMIGMRKHKEIATSFGISVAAVCAIKSRRTWSHLD